MNYIVQKESLEIVADSIRAKAGISEKLEFPLGWKEAVDGITGGGGGDNDGGSPNYREVKVVTNINAGVSVTAREPEVNDNYTHCLYNGVRLPRPPEDDIAICPYCFIRYNGTTYELFMASCQWYHKEGYAYPLASTGSFRRYSCVSDTWEVTDSTDNSSLYNWYVASSGWSLVWSSYDMPNGSPTATSIYFAGSEPVPTE